MSFVIHVFFPMTHHVRLLFFLSFLLNHVCSQPGFEAGRATMRGR